MRNSIFMLTPGITLVQRRKKENHAVKEYSEWKETLKKDKKNIKWFSEGWSIECYCERGNKNAKKRNNNNNTKTLLEN